MKTLETIQKLAKVGKTLSKIAFIFSIIGAVGTAVGIGGVAVLGDDALKLGGDSVTSAIQNESDMDIPAMIAAMAVGMVFLIAQIFISKFAEIYFKNELSDGTPFTVRGAKELLRLGIICIAVSLGTALVCSIGLGVASYLIPSIEEASNEIEGIHSVGIGIAFIVCSLLCRLGAEMNESQSEKTEETVEQPETVE